MFVYGRAEMGVSLYNKNHSESFLCKRNQLDYIKYLISKYFDNVTFTDPQRIYSLERIENTVAGFRNYCVAKDKEDEM